MPCGRFYRHWPYECIPMQRFQAIFPKNFTIILIRFVKMGKIKDMKSIGSNLIFKQTMAGVSLPVRMTALLSSVIKPRPFFRKAGCKMKRLMLIICLAVFFVGGCGSNRHIVLGGGVNSYIVGYGAITESEDRDKLLSGGITYVYGQEKPNGQELGGFAKYGIEIFKDKKLFATVLGGISFAQEDYAYTEKGEEVYANSTIHGIVGGGVTYLINDEWLFQVDYDNRRDLMISVGCRF